MTSLDQPAKQDSFADRSIGLLARQISAAEIHVGGGSAAAATATLAAATAELVVSLTSKRKSTGEIGGMLQRDLQRLAELQTELPGAGERDELALDALMQSYRSRLADRDERLVAATESSLEIAGLAVEVVEIASRQVAQASRFTASDLGAAAALAHGAAVAALLTAKININLLDTSQAQNQARGSQLRDRVDTAATRAADRIQTALVSTEQRIEGAR